MSNIFKKLSEIDITSMVKQKGKFWYMPWSNAVREVVKNYPNMSWEFTSYDGLPYLETPLGYFVECTVNIEDVKRVQMMPVLDFKNQTNMAPKANDINKSQMRALAKAISLHGLGLDLWAGEDLVGYDEPTEATVNEEQYNSLFNLICDADGKFNKIGSKLSRAYKFEDISLIPSSKYEKIFKAAS